MPSDQPTSHTTGFTRPPAATCIGPGTTLRGDLTIDSEAVIEGRFEGTITGRGTLLIRAGGSVKGTITLAQVIVEGTVEGDITAGSLTITESASVSGVVRCGPAAGDLTPLHVASRAYGEPSIIIEPHLGRTRTDPAQLTTPVAPPVPPAQIQDIETTLAVFERTLADFMATKTPTATH